MPWTFWVALVWILAERFEQQHSDLIHFKRFLPPPGPDGTCLKLDHWGDLMARAGT